MTDYLLCFSITKFIDFNAPISSEEMLEPTCNPDLGTDAALLEQIKGLSDPDALLYSPEHNLAEVSFFNCNQLFCCESFFHRFLDFMNMDVK